MSLSAEENTAPAKSSFLPASLTEGLDAHLWGWVGYTHVSPAERESLHVAEVGLDITKTFSDRVAATAEVNFIDSDWDSKVQVKQAFVSVLLSKEHQTIFTGGRFDANFGVEPRDFWNRMTGTTSLLFGAQPQQLTGVMLTQPIGDTGIKVRPFLVTSFQEWNVPNSPSGGFTLEYSPDKKFSIAATNWWGPGFVLAYPGDWWRGYGSAVENWWGPNLETANGGLLYFLDVKAIWRPYADLMLAGEYLFASNTSSQGRFEWDGLLFLVNYDLTDRWRVFARWSFLNDPSWLVTGIFQRRHELSGGVGYQICKGVEARAEYRHDFSSAVADQDTVSVHLTFGF